MAGSTAEELPCQTTEDAKTMAILLASPSGEEPPEGRRRQTQRKQRTAKSSRARYPTPAQSQGASRLAILPANTDKNRRQSPPVDNYPSCGQLRLTRCPSFG